MIPTYIIHHPPLASRKAYLSRVLPFARFIEETNFDICFEPDEREWKKRTKDLYEEEIPFRELAYGDKDCIEKHYAALTEISNLTVPGLILEDDAIILDGFWECLHRVVQKENYNQYDLLFIGGAFPHTVAPSIYPEHEVEMAPFVPKGHPCSNTVCSYVVKPEIAAALSHHIWTKGAVLPIDFEINYICKQLNLKVCHFLPYVVLEGSSSGYYEKSQIR
jgi:GR25 family glycosyltransferase involved in LPS biosynthesis